MTIPPEDAMTVTTHALEVDALRLRAWQIPSNKSHSPEARALRVALHRAERALDEAVTQLREKITTTTEVVTQSQGERS